MFWECTGVLSITYINLLESLHLHATQDSQGLQTLAPLIWSLRAVDLGRVLSSWPVIDAKFNDNDITIRLNTKNMHGIHM